MPEQVYTSQEVDFGESAHLFWPSFGGLAVPAHRILEITTLTLNYFPKDTGGILGRLGISGRDAADATSWCLQIVYVEPKKTLHLTFPSPLRLEAGGYVGIAFTSEGPGTIFVEANGALV